MFKTAIRRFSTTFHQKNKLRSILQEQLDEIKSSGLYKRERVITTAQDAKIKTTDSDSEVLNFCANNYLGLSNHPEIVDAAIDALKTHGFGMSSVRFICGTQDIHKQLENNLTEFHETEDTILYPSCFDANGGLFEGILSDQDAVISADMNHASIIDGIRLCKAERHRYKHLDMKDLEDKLQRTQDKRLRLVATDGVFSMDGDIAPLDKIVALCQKYDANLFVDDCHGTGFFGPKGKGTPEHFGVIEHVDVLNTTLGKALGGATGGYTTGRKEVVEILRQRARPYLFSNSIAPSVAGASLKTLEILQRDTKLRDKLMNENTPLFRKGMREAGFEISGHDDCPIVPVMIYDAKKAVEIADDLLKQGIYVIAFSYPVVPKGKARIRVQISAAHSTEQIERTVQAFTEVAKKRGLIQ
uniref:2-amino-3-ketobutyrate coenzyme A ligase, mitochondrial n=1 Tax=Percolomonas cosmopolitus TaxID=63605 RepID=A0A7S1KNZ7_9EUKA